MSAWHWYCRAERARRNMVGAEVPWDSRNMQRDLEKKVEFLWEMSKKDTSDMDNKSRYEY